MMKSFSRLLNSRGLRPIRFVSVMYNSRGHKPCFYAVQRIQTLNDPFVKSCWAFDGGKCETCIKCDHPWKTHMIVNVEHEEVIVQVVNPNVREMIDQASSSSDILAASMRSTQDLIRDLNAKQDWLIKSNAKIGKYIQTKGILYYNPDLKKYLDMLIREEEQRMQAGANNQTVLEGLKEVREEYEAEVKILTENLNAEADVTIASDAEIEQLLNELRSTNIGGIDLGQYVS